MQLAHVAREILLRQTSSTRSHPYRKPSHWESGTSATRRAKRLGVQLDISDFSPSNARTRSRGERQQTVKHASSAARHSIPGPRQRVSQPRIPAGGGQKRSELPSGWQSHQTVWISLSKMGWHCQCHWSCRVLAIFGCSPLLYSAGKL
jgi:hypothetical protein